MPNYVIWNKNDHDWNVLIEDEKKFKKQDKNFYQCPFCGDDRLNFKLILNQETNKFESGQWRCQLCAKEIKFERLSKLTRNFINNLVLNELNLIYENPVKLFKKVKKGKKIDVKLLGPELGIKSKNESIDLICGKCKKKNQFIVQNKENKFYQCLNCGFFNILD